MQQNAFMQSMKTIAQNAITKAGYDKTRNGKIVGVNSVTNTYSVKVDGIVYNNVKTVNDYEYNVGDIVKVNIPMNNPSQAYIASSILSDDSIGKKLANTITLVDETNNRIDSIIDIMGSMYQLDVDVSYASNSSGYVIATYTAILSQDGSDVTSDHDYTEFEWYMEKTTGRTTFEDSPAYSIQLSTEDYYYGQSVLLEWTYTYTDDDGNSQTAQLRYRVTLFDNNAVEQVAKYTTEIDSGGVFVHRADGNYDVGNDYTSTYAYGVKIADTVDIIRGGYVWGSFGGSYLTIGRTSDNNYNVYINSTGSIQFRYNSTVLSQMTSSAVTLGQTSSYNTYIDSSNIYLRYGTTALAQLTSSALTLGKTSTYNTYMTTGGVYLRNGTTNVASFTSSAITLGLTSTYNTYITTSAVNLRYGTTVLAQFNTGGLTLKNSSGYTLSTISASAFNLYTGTSTGYVLASLSSSGLVLRNTSNVPVFQLTNSNGQILAQTGTDSGAANWRRILIGANSSTYGQPGINISKRYSNGGYTDLEIRLNDVSQNCQISCTNGVYILPSGWSNYISVADNGVFIHGAFYNQSDKRLKQHIEYLNINQSIEFIRNLRPALYNMSGAKAIGLYAQDVQSIDKWGALVKCTQSYNGKEVEEILTLDYLGAMMPLIVYCQELEKRIEQLEQKEN